MIATLAGFYAAAGAVLWLAMRMTCGPMPSEWKRWELGAMVALCVLGWPMVVGILLALDVIDGE